MSSRTLSKDRSGADGCVSLVLSSRSVSLSLLSLLKRAPVHHRPGMMCSLLPLASRPSTIAHLESRSAAYPRSGTR